VYFKLYILKYKIYIINAIIQNIKNLCGCREKVTIFFGRRKKRNKFGCRSNVYL